MGIMNLTETALGLNPSGRTVFLVPADLVASLSLEVPLLTRGHRAKEEGLPVFVHALARPPAAWTPLGRGAGGAAVPQPMLLLAGGDLAGAAPSVRCRLHAREHATSGRTLNFLTGTSALFSHPGAPLRNAKPGDRLVFLWREPSVSFSLAFSREVAFPFSFLLGEGEKNSAKTSKKKTF